MILGQSMPAPSDFFPGLREDDKIPRDWGSPKPNKKQGTGYRWQDPDDVGNGIRIDKGDPDHPLASQQVDHVVVRYRGHVIGRGGNPISGSIRNDPVNAHIPIKDWLQWRNWYSP
ncbi:hypothetical protein QUF72_05110 [Desulfobacterales bacterium HSG2]|nr:hypothetical protein [Desulfobacterales bacterium HSG2]